jgi:hypothetical protein
MKGGNTMISAKEAYQLVSDLLAKKNEGIQITDMTKGPTVYAIGTAYDDGTNGPDDDYVVNAEDGSIKPIFKLGWLIEYPDCKSWPTIDITKFHK